ncbi:MAG: hypothetical protein RLZZ428_273 [Pseudomonadota bacterium]|jgi:thioredoxin-related protein
MKKIFFACVIVTSTVFSLEWVKDIPTAFALAKQDHKMVMVYVEGETCRWCKKMKHRTLEDSLVEKELANLIVVKVFQEDSEAMASLPKVDGVPTTFFMNEEKKVFGEVLGYSSVDEFLDSLKQATTATTK